MKRLLLLIVAFAVFTSSCVLTTMVTIETIPDDVEVYVDSQLIGDSPVTVRMSNAVWEDPEILLKKEGYRDLRTSPQKEVKALNLISGLIFVAIPLLWVYGPEPYQSFMLSEEK